MKKTRSHNRFNFLLMLSIFVIINIGSLYADINTYCDESGLVRGSRACLISMNEYPHLMGPLYYPTIVNPDYSPLMKGVLAPFITTVQNSRLETLILPLKEINFIIPPFMIYTAVIKQLFWASPSSEMIYSFAVSCELVFNTVPEAIELDFIREIMYLMSELSPSCFSVYKEESQLLIDFIDLIEDCEEYYDHSMLYSYMEILALMAQTTHNPIYFHIMLFLEHKEEFYYLSFDEYQEMHYSLFSTYAKQLI